MKRKNPIDVLDAQTRHIMALHEQVIKNEDRLLDSFRKVPRRSEYRALDSRGIEQYGALSSTKPDCNYVQIGKHRRAVTWHEYIEVSH